MELPTKPTKTPPPRPAFRPRDVGVIEEAKLVAPVPPARPSPTLQKRQKPLDLAGNAPAWLLLGGNSSGKTTWARWAVGRALEANRDLALAALDKGDRTLASFFPDVEMPPTRDKLEVAAWVCECLGYVAENRIPAVMDFGGGGDEFLAGTLDSAPTIVEDMAAAGVSLVAALFLTPRQQDLQVLVMLDALGFKPAATVLVLNEAHVERGTEFDDAFSRVIGHGAFKAAVARGAYVVRMPRLFPQSLALEVADKFLRFNDARDGRVPEGSTVTPIRGFDRSRVNRWLADMEAAHEAVRDAMP